MPYQSNIISAAVSVYDVQRAIGVGSGDVATLCTSENIKQWARYRPIDYPNRSQQISEAQRASKNYGIGNIPVWKSGKTIGNMVNFWTGLDTSSTNYPSGYDSSTLPAEWWTKVLPATTSFKRLTDFVCTEDTTKGYFSQAEPPIGSIDQLGNDSRGNATVVYRMGLNGVTAGLTITYSDLGTMSDNDFQNLYFGVVIKTANTIYLATQDNTVGTIDGAGSTLWSMGASIHFKLPTSGELYTAALNSTPVKVFPVLTSVKRYYGTEATIASISANTTGTFIALQEPEEVAFTITQTQGIITNFFAWKDTTQSTRLIYFSFELACTEATVTHYFKSDLELLDGNGNIIGTTQVSSTTVGAGQQVSVSGSIDTQYYSAASAVHLTVNPTTTDTSQYKKQAEATAIVSGLPRT